MTRGRGSVSAHSNSLFRLAPTPGTPADLQDPKGLAQRSPGGVQDSAPVSGRLLPSAGHHEQGHRGVPVQSAALPTIHGHRRLQGQRGSSIGTRPVTHTHAHTHTAG